jgi:hypothetical protein
VGVGPMLVGVGSGGGAQAARCALICSASAADSRRRAILRSYCICRFSQNSGLLPKYRPSRSAVSAVIRRPVAHDLGDPVQEDADRLREPVLRQPVLLQELLAQHLARRDRRELVVRDDRFLSGSPGVATS